MQADVHYKHLVQAGRKSPAAMEKRQKQQVLDGTGSHSLNSACGWLSCIGRLSVELRQQQHSAVLWATKQPSLGTALLAPHADRPRKGGLNKARLTPTSAKTDHQPSQQSSFASNEPSPSHILKAFLMLISNCLRAVCFCLSLF